MSNVELIYYLCIVVLVCIGYSWIYDAFVLGEAVKYRPSVKRTTNKLMNVLSGEFNNEIFMKVGLKLSVKRYVAYRNMAAIVLFILALLKASTGDSEYCTRLLIVTLILFLLSAPKESRKGKPTILKKMIDVVAAKKLQIKDDELVVVIGQMKNQILSTNAESLSTDYLLSRLMHYTKISRPNFILALGYIRKGEREKAGNVFMKDFGTKLGVDFGRILIKLDYLPATEFLEQINLLQETIQSKRETLKARKQNSKKILAYTLAAVFISTIIMNYVYIVLYATMEVLKSS